MSLLFPPTPGVHTLDDAAPPAGHESLIADRGEFIDALARLRRGQLLYASWKPLSRYGLLDELPAQPRQGRMRCYRLSPRGRDFADRAVAAWKSQPLWRRLAMRLGA